jgi:4-cresol dehydrogenase (hydroxylating)
VVSCWSKLAEVVGNEYVLRDSSTLTRYARTTGFVQILPDAVVLPKCTHEVQSIVRIARENKLALYPISGGKNWGYGDAAPTQEHQIVIDLSRMNKIIEVNEESCYAVIEPGVTQGALATKLKLHHPTLWMDATGAGESCSIVGNFSDRGFGHTRYSDHYVSAAQLQVVLGTGEVIETGFGSYPNAHAAHTYKWGIGPILDGLFTQSNFGIITRLTVNLMPAPEDYCIYAFSIASDEDFAEALSVLSRLRLEGVIQSAVHIANDLRAISGKTRYPWEAMKGETPLRERVRQELARSFHVARWTGTGIITGNPLVIAALRSTLKKRLAKYNPKFIPKKILGSISLAKRVTQKIPRLASMSRYLELISMLADMLTGQPSNDALYGATWRVRDDKKGKGSYDPLDAGAGLAWISPILPATPKCLKEVLSFLPKIFEKHTFDFMATFTMINERSLVLVSNISFDQSRPEEVELAKTCYQEALDELFCRGYVPYRMDPKSSAKLTSHAPSFWKLVQNIKLAADPDHVISPGRYLAEDVASAGLIKMEKKGVK